MSDGLRESGKPRPWNYIWWCQIRVHPSRSSYVEHGDFHPVLLTRKPQLHIFRVESGKQW